MQLYHTVMGPANSRICLRSAHNSRTAHIGPTRAERWHGTCRLGKVCAKSRRVKRRNEPHHEMKRHEPGGTREV
jgi:hypothetical protein